MLVARSCYNRYGIVVSSRRRHTISCIVSWARRCVLETGFFFFKQKTAYEIGVRLVGSEMCIRDRFISVAAWAEGPAKSNFTAMEVNHIRVKTPGLFNGRKSFSIHLDSIKAVSYTHLRAHETDSYLVCRLLLEKKKHIIHIYEHTRKNS